MNDNNSSNNSRDQEARKQRPETLKDNEDEMYWMEQIDKN